MRMMHKDVTISMLTLVVKVIIQIFMNLIEKVYSIGFKNYLYLMCLLFGKGICFSVVRSEL